MSASPSELQLQMTRQLAHQRQQTNDAKTLSYATMKSWSELILHHDRWFNSPPIPDQYGTFDPDSLIHQIAADKNDQQWTPPMFWTTFSRPISEWSKALPLISLVHSHGVAVVDLYLSSKDKSKDIGRSLCGFLVPKRIYSIVQYALDKTMEFTTFVSTSSDAVMNTAGVPVTYRITSDSRKDGIVCRRLSKSLPDHTIWHSLQDRFVLSNQNDTMWNLVSNNFVLLYVLDNIPNRYAKVFKILVEILNDCSDIVNGKPRKSPSSSTFSLFGSSSVNDGDKYCKPAIVGLHAEMQFAATHQKPYTTWQRFADKPRLRESKTQQAMTTMVTYNDMDSKSQQVVESDESTGVVDGLSDDNDNEYEPRPLSTIPEDTSSTSASASSTSVPSTVVSLTSVPLTDDVKHETTKQEPTIPDAPPLVSQQLFPTLFGINGHGESTTQTTTSTAQTSPATATIPSFQTTTRKPRFIPKPQ